MTQSFKPDSDDSGVTENLMSQDGGALTEGAGVEVSDLPGIITALGDPDAVITEAGLARLFGRCSASVKRAVKRDELPPGVKLFGTRAWTARVIVAHLERRLAEAAEEEERLKTKVAVLRP